MFMTVGGCIAFSQHRKIVTGQPVPAVVLSAEVERRTSRDSDGHTSVTYAPVIRYRYDVDGVSHTCDDVHPISISTSDRGWAQSIVDQYSTGQNVEAYINPKKPGKAFLIRKYSFFPYLFILFPMIFVCVGLGVGLSMGASKVKPPTPLPSTGGWFEVKPASRIVDRQRAALLGLALWDGVGFLACGHFFLVASPPFGLSAIIVTSIYAAVSVIPLGIFIYNILLRRNIDDARLFVSAEKVKRGEAISIGVRQLMHNPLMVEQAELGFVCTVTTKTSSGGKTTISTHKGYENLVPLLHNQQAKAGEHLEFSAELTIPEDKHASTIAGDNSYPRHHWKIQTRVKLADSPDYKAGFPVLVE